MEWSKCYRKLEEVESRKPEDRSQYQRDYDRIIFSSAFRRLQNKTQVFPLPGTTFVHNRLTHSLEVASVGRSLGSLVGYGLSEKNQYAFNDDVRTFYQYELANVIASGCLAHDLGNPAFGHSGEDAISNYFKEYENENIDGENLKSHFKDVEWKDLTNFEGNANAFRLLTQTFKGKSQNGMGLSSASLASILKYPCSSMGTNKSSKHTKKYGFFQSEKEQFKSLVNELNLHKESDLPLIYRRHPFVYLVEAADDICYNIIDMEDAHRLRILSKELVASAFIHVIEDLKLKQDSHEGIWKKYQTIGDENEAIAYLRSKCINSLVNACAAEYLNHDEEIISATYNDSLFSVLFESCPSLVQIEKISLEKIYRHPKVLEIEIAGYHIMSGLLQLYVPAVLRTNKSKLHRTLLTLMPHQFTPDEYMSPYLKTMCVLDHISSMTDAYAVEHYRKLTGIEISQPV